MTTKTLKRALARREFFGEFDWSKLSRAFNSFDEPIGKPICVRSMRRFLRLSRKDDLRYDNPCSSKRKHRRATSSSGVARIVRHIKRMQGGV